MIVGRGGVAAGTFVIPVLYFFLAQLGGFSAAFAFSLDLWLLFQILIILPNYFIDSLRGALRAIGEGNICFGLLAVLQPPVNILIIEVKGLAAGAVRRSLMARESSPLAVVKVATGGKPFARLGNFLLRP